MITISIVIPCFNERDYIERCLASCVRQNSSTIAFQIEVIVVDGMSADGTRAILETFCTQHSEVTVIDNPQKVTPIALNKGIDHAKGEWVMILGAHSELHPNYLALALQTLAALPTIDCIGGIIESTYANAESEAIGLAQTSPFGVGNAYFRTGTKSGFVDTVAFGLYRKSAVKKVGGFDSELVRNQDDEFNYRWLKEGFTIYLNPQLRTNYYVRGSVKKLFRQYFQYGYWKVYVNKKHKALTTVRQLVPFLFVGFCFGGPLLFLLEPLLAIPYTVILAIYSALAAKTALSRKSPTAPASTIFRALLTLHFAYGLGYWKGCIAFLILGQKPPKAAGNTR